MLPYVTPYGVFTERRSDALVTYSGLIPLDFDKLDSEEEACNLRDWIFDDSWLNAKLSFVSPSGKGVKAFIGYEHLLEPGVEVDKSTLNKFLNCALNYVSCSYWRYLGKCADPSGKDLARACLLCHDADVFYQHTSHVLSFMNKTLSMRRPNIEKQMLFDSMGDDEFSLKDFMAKAKELGLKERTAQTWLYRDADSKNGIFERRGYTGEFIRRKKEDA